MDNLVKQLKRKSINPSSAVDLGRKLLEEDPIKIFRGEESNMESLIKNLMNILGENNNYVLLYSLMEKYATSSEYYFIATAANEKIEEVNSLLRKSLKK